MVGRALRSGPIELAIFDFRVLGPLEVRRNGELLSLQGLRQRTVLAVLLIEAGHVVSNDRLAELVWDGAPPGDAHGTIQVYVSKLRRTLAPRDDPHAADPVLVTQSPGYMIDASTEAIDAARFTRICDDAARHLREGRRPRGTAPAGRGTRAGGAGSRTPTSASSGSLKRRSRVSTNCVGGPSKIEPTR